MKNAMTDQADGLRRLMADSAGRLVALLGSDASDDAVGVTRNLVAALVRQGKQVLLLDESAGAPATELQRQGRLVLVHAVLNQHGALSPLAAQADHIVVTLQPNAASIKQAYGCIKKLHQAHPSRRLRVLVNAASDVTEAQRILANLAQTCQRYLSLSLDSAGWVRVDPLIARARELNLTVVEAFQTSPAAIDFCRVAADLLQWPCPPASVAKSVRPAAATQRQPADRPGVGQSVMAR